MLRRKLPIEPFLLWLIGTVVLASLLPARGMWAPIADHIADAAIALLFFLHGAKLSRQAILQGMGNWRLHAAVLAATYILFPAIGFATHGLSNRIVGASLSTGMLYLTLLPSTVQSSVAFVAMARGNVAAAVCSASLSSLVGIVITPLLAALLMGRAGGGGMSLGSVETIALQLLLPFVTGHLLRPWIGGWVDRHKALLQPVDRGSILLVVYTAFSAAVVNGIWRQIGWGELVGVLVLSSVILGVVLAVNMLAARLLGLSREDSAVLLFCGSKKSLVSGVPMAGALFPPAQVGLIVLPLMIFHQLQLFACAWIAGRLQREADGNAKG